MKTLSVLLPFNFINNIMDNVLLVFMEYFLNERDHIINLLFLQKQKKLIISKQITL